VECEVRRCGNEDVPGKGRRGMKGREKTSVNYVSVLSVQKKRKGLELLVEIGWWDQ
jgi:hypothetical protein